MHFLNYFVSEMVSHSSIRYQHVSYNSINEVNYFIDFDFDVSNVNPSKSKLRHQTQKEPLTPTPIPILMHLYMTRIMEKIYTNSGPFPSLCPTPHSAHRISWSEIRLCAAPYTGLAKNIFCTQQPAWHLLCATDHSAHR